MASPVLTCLSLCSGVGGLELGLGLALGDRLSTVGYVERDAYAATCLLARMEDAALEPAPVWCGNLEDLDTAPFRGVDIVTAGFPCPPFSAAGKRQGTDDPRWIWPAIFRIVRSVEPRFVFLENVPGLLSPAKGQLAGIGWVLGDLAEIGFDAEWTVLSARDLGATHLRKRVFILSHTPGRRRGGEVDSSQVRRENPRRPASGVSRPNEGVGAYVADADRDEPERDREPGVVGGPAASRQAREREWTGDAARSSGPNVADAGGARCEGDRAEPDGTPLPDACRSGWLFPPGRDDYDRWAAILARYPGLAPAVESSFCGVADGLAVRMDNPYPFYRSDRLRVIGNGCVPVVAGAAFLALADRAGIQF